MSQAAAPRTIAATPPICLGNVSAAPAVGEAVAAEADCEADLEAALEALADADEAEAVDLARVNNHFSKSPFYNLRC